MDLEQIKNLSKEMGLLVEENKKLQSLRERYVEFSKKLHEMSDLIADIADEIDPVVAGQSRRVGGTDLALARKRNQDMLRDVYDKMTKGIHVTTEFLKTTYPEIAQGSLFFLMSKIENMPNVKKVKDGTKVRYYCENA